MNYTTRCVGWGGFMLGIVVLFSYYRRRKSIANASAELRLSRAFLVWSASAAVTAVCFLLLLSLWALGGNRVTDNEYNARVFVVGLYVFMSGAIAWPWVLQLELTLNEMSALWITALGSFIMCSATWWQVMSVPFTSFLFFHHLVVDALWWPYYGRTSVMDYNSRVGALYLFYFAPLSACIPLSFFGATTSVAIIVVIITALHFVVATIVAWPHFMATAKQRYTQRLAVVADVLITVALGLSLAHLIDDTPYSWIAVIAATLGNLFCFVTRNIPKKQQFNPVLYSVVLLQSD